MTASRRTATLFAAALAGAATAARAQSTEYTTFQSLWYEVRTTEGAACRAMGLLNLPPGWRSGDAIAVLLTETTLRDATRHPLVAALLEDGAAVLEIVSSPVAHCDGDHRGTSRPDARTDFREALKAAGSVGAGLAVAIGYGAEGEAALAVAAQAATEADPAAGPRYAAGVALGPMGARFAGGAAPDAAERWPDRAPRLCAALSPPASGAETRSACAVALATPVAPQRVVGR